MFCRELDEIDRLLRTPRRLVVLSGHPFSNVFAPFKGARLKAKALLMQPMPVFVGWPPPARMV